VFNPLAEQLRENQPRDNNGAVNNGRYEGDPLEEQRNNNRDGNDGGYETAFPAGQREYQQTGNNREGNVGGYAVFLAGGVGNNNSCRIVLSKDFKNIPISLGGANRDI